jgi:mono/diheme cytochrome c family protein
MDDFRKILYGVVIGFIAIIVGWVSFLTYSGCGYSLDNCNASVPKTERTSIPSLVPATLPAPVRFLVPTATASATSAATATTAPTESATTIGAMVASPTTASALTPTSTSPVAASASTSTNQVTASAVASTLASGSSSGVPRPSNPGGPGDAINLTGDPNSGAQIFATNCVTCHNAQGKGGIPNPGSDAGSCPALNPINPALKSSDHMTFVTNLDLFIQHGSTPAGPGPINTMPPWGDSGKMTQQQIADVVAYVISLNP